MKLIIAGGRDFCDYSILESVMKDNFNCKVKEIVSGTARGADSLGELYAKNNGIKVKRFPADWDKYGKRAGYIRNLEMANYGTHLLAFWDGESRGTGMMIEIAKKHGLKVTVVKY